jgi:hypothetical protein
VSWADATSADLWRRHRALAWRTPLFSTWRGKRLQLLGVREPRPAEALAPLPGETGAPGTLVPCPRTGLFFARCADGAWLPCEQLRMEGRRAQGAADFANGYAIPTTLAPSGRGPWARLGS